MRISFIEPSPAAVRPSANFTRPSESTLTSVLERVISRIALFSARSALRSSRASMRAWRSPDASALSGLASFLALGVLLVVPRGVLRELTVCFLALHLAEHLGLGLGQ